MKKVDWNEFKADLKLYVEKDGIRIIVALVLAAMAVAIINEAGNAGDPMVSLVGIGVAAPFVVGFVILMYMPGDYEFAKLQRAIERLEKKEGS